MKEWQPISEDINLGITTHAKSQEDGFINFIPNAKKVRLFEVENK